VKEVRERERLEVLDERRFRISEMSLKGR